MAGKCVLKVANAKRARKWRLLKKNDQEFYKREAERARENRKIARENRKIARENMKIARENRKIALPIPADTKPAYLARKRRNLVDHRARKRVQYGTPARTLPVRLLRLQGTEVEASALHPRKRRHGVRSHFRVPESVTVNVPFSKEKILKAKLKRCSASISSNT